MHRSALWRPYTQEGLAAPPLRVDRAKGAHFFTKDGRKIFDGVSSWWVITHGHCEAEIVESVRKQAEKLDQVLFANFTHDAAEELAIRLKAVAPPKLEHVFLSENGSTAVEVAIKMALQYHVQTGSKNRKKFLAFEHAYHGDTVGAMSVSAKGPFTMPFRYLTFEVVRAAHPSESTAPKEEWIADFREKIQLHQHELAGVIIEPLLQGAAGMIVWPAEAVEEVARLCHEAGVLLICDEVLTGFGRTGSLFVSSALDLEPDFLCLSKGLTGGILPLGATLTSRQIFEAFRSKEKQRMFFHGHSFTGNPLACAAAAANLRLCEKSGFGQSVQRVAETQRLCLQRLRTKYQVSDPRICGTIAAFEIGPDDKNYLAGGNHHLINFALNRGVYLRPMGNTVYMLPPYSALKSDLEQAWAVLGNFLETVK